MLFYNGQIMTLDENREVVTSLQVLDGKITSLGLESFDSEAGIDLQGKTMLPGFIDTHMHLLGYGMHLNALNVIGCKSIEELVDRVKSRVETQGSGTLIMGRGWDENRYGGILPTRDDLDKVSPDNPLVLNRVCGHLLVANSKALEVFGIDDSVVTPEGGAIDRDKSGRLTGVFRENAMGLIYGNLPQKTMAEIEEALTIAGKAVLAQGITTIHSDDLGGVNDIEQFIQLYRKLFLEGKLPKTHLHIKPEQIKEARALGYKTGTKLDGITIEAVKVFADGSLGARTAAMCADYSDAPGEKGILCYSDTDLYKIIQEAHQADFAVAVHGIGDAAALQAVKLISQVQKDNPKPYLRHRLIHAQILNQEVMELMQKYDIIAEIQPVFITTDLHWAEERVGDRMKTSYNWQSLWQKGIRLSGSSDCPVEAVNPLWGIYCAVTRKDLEGQPVGGWYPDEALSLEQALQLFTICGAYTGSEETEKGTLVVGKVADLVVLSPSLDQNLPTDQIKDIQVEMTILDGKIVYQK